jgi:hypothetical protein
MKELLATVWDEKKLLAEVDRMERLVRTNSTLPKPIVGGSLSEVRNFITKRRAAVEAELARPAQPWNYPLRRSVITEKVGSAKFSFSTSWTTNLARPPRDLDTAQVDLEFYGRKYSTTFRRVHAGPDMQAPKNASVLLSGTFPGMTEVVHLAVSTPLGQFAKPGPHPFNFWETRAAFMAGNFETGNFRILGFFANGTVNFTKAGTTEDAPVTGEAEGEMQMLPWEDLDLKTLKLTKPQNE